jgi:hypothetical protein
VGGAKAGGSATRRPGRSVPGGSVPGLASARAEEPQRVMNRGCNRGHRP